MAIPGGRIRPTRRARKVQTQPIRSVSRILIPGASTFAAAVSTVAGAQQRASAVACSPPS